MHKTAKRADLAACAWHFIVAVVVASPASLHILLAPGGVDVADEPASALAGRAGCCLRFGRCGGVVLEWLLVRALDAINRIASHSRAFRLH